MEGAAPLQLLRETSGNSARFHLQIKQRLGPNKQPKRSNGLGHMLQISCQVRLITAAQRSQRLLKHFHMGSGSRPWQHQKTSESVQELTAGAPAVLRSPGSPRNQCGYWSGHAGLCAPSTVHQTTPETLNLNAHLAPGDC